MRRPCDGCRVAGRFACGDGVTCGVATLTAVAAGEAHELLLLFRKGMWELYLAYSEAGFRSGYLDVYQWTFAPSGRN